MSKLPQTCRSRQAVRLLTADELEVLSDEMTSHRVQAQPEDGT